MCGSGYVTLPKTSNMIKVKVFESQWYRVKLGENAYEGRCDFYYCIYVFGFLVYSKFYKEISLQQSKLIFKGCEIIDLKFNSTKY